MWGCSAGGVGHWRHLAVFPTYVGMFRSSVRRMGLPVCFPHVCGDVPGAILAEARAEGFSPRMWGCSLAHLLLVGIGLVFPTYVGMFRSFRVFNLRSVSFPHVCGDVPRCGTLSPVVCPFSPRMGGCSVLSLVLICLLWVFPTYVGMFRNVVKHFLSWLRFPHVCGDVPTGDRASQSSLGFSPRMWGCSGRWRRGTPPRRVFPTYVGMFRGPRRKSMCRASFPHVCGDVPCIWRQCQSSPRFSPRMWGCSVFLKRAGFGCGVFPTYVGMFRWRTRRARARGRFPHVCGDVPPVYMASPTPAKFSPRMWGCSVSRRVRLRHEDVFPTYVGMFRAGRRAGAWGRGFPHVCGDVPGVVLGLPASSVFSPRMWGCSLAGTGGGRGSMVFPTYVGMFRRRGRTPESPRCFPHVCGDVPSARPAAPPVPPFSPRMWGCSEHDRFSRHRLDVFPTYVGMFRSMAMRRRII